MYKPILARSDNRSIVAQLHPFSGSPDEWFEDCTISFDFFIDWKHIQVRDEIWVKRLLNKNEFPPDVALNEYMKAEEPAIDKMVEFSKEYKFELHFILFDDTQNWQNNSSILFDIYLEETNWKWKKVSLEHIKERIKVLSGGAVSVGAKGLMYSTSNLEAVLSHTDSLWPGDADGLLLHKNTNKPLAILEYKKHTKMDYLHSVEEFYNNGKDRRKYDRLQLLKERIGNEIPVIVLTYPTTQQINTILLENVSVNVHRKEMKIISSWKCKVPAHFKDTYVIKRAIYDMIKRK